MPVRMPMGRGYSDRERCCRELCCRRGRRRRGGSGVGEVDFGRTAEDYARHRAGFPDAFFERAVRLGVGLPGQALLDTGTGTLARGFAVRGARVVAIDPAAGLLERARDLDRAAGVSVEYRVARAEATGL